MENENIQELKFQVGEAWKGVYSSSTAYGLANVVQDPTGLSIYRSLKSGNVDHPLSNASWWFRIIDMSSIKAESDRIAALNEAIAQDEALRVAADELRQQHEAERVAAETQRNEAEQARISAEQARVNTESARAIAEQQRITAEESRVSAESARVQAEQARVLAETLRANAEDQRAANEQNRIAAEQQRIERAESDHQRVESDLADIAVYTDSLGAFDLSKHNAVDGVLATYADLSAALTALNALDSKYKYGGMSFKFVLTSDNKYVQYRLMAITFSTTPNDWQGVDKEPTAGSHNLVESGGVSKEIVGISHRTEGFSFEVQETVETSTQLLVPCALSQDISYKFKNLGTASSLNLIDINDNIIPIADSWQNNQELTVTPNVNIKAIRCWEGGTDAHFTINTTSDMHKSISALEDDIIEINTDKLPPFSYTWLYASFGKRPTFSYNSSNGEMTITMPTDTTMVLYSTAYDNINITGNGEVYVVPGWKCLLFDVKTKQFSIKAVGDSVTNDNIVFFAQTYGIVGGVLAPYYQNSVNKTQNDSITTANENIAKNTATSYNWLYMSPSVRPTFSVINQYSIKVSIPATTLRLCSIGGHTRKDIVLSYTTEWSISYTQFLYYNINTNEFAITDTSVSTSAGWVLMLARSGDTYSGLLAPYYNEQNFNQFVNLQQDFNTLEDKLKISYPSYYNTQIEDVEEDVLSHSVVGKDGCQFVFITDLHWANNQKHSPALIRNVINNTPVDKIVLGGDYISSYAVKSNAIKSLNDCIQSFVNLGYDSFPIYGNHDKNSMSDVPQTAILTTNEVYSLMCPNLPYYVVDGTDLNFYYDDAKTKTRYIFLQSASSGNVEGVDEDSVPTATLTFLQNTLDSTSAGWHIIVFCHALGHVTGSVGAWEFVYSWGGDQVKSKVDTHNAGGSSTVEAIISGHVHIDFTDKTSGGVPIVWTDTDSTRVPAGVDAEVGTVNEQCFDIMTIDYTEKKIYCDRVGRGESRVISYSGT